MKVSLVKHRIPDAVEIARLIRQADELTAIRLLGVWGQKQREIGARNEIMAQLERIHAEA